MVDRPLKVRFRFEPQRQKIMVSRGVDGICFSGQKNSFEIDVALVRMKPEIPNVITRSISVKKQLQTLKKIYNLPLRGHPVIGIGSYPSDLRAKMLAANIVDWAITAQNKAVRGNLVRRDYPLWHKVFGGLGDPLRDRGPDDNPSMIVLSNIDENSTAHKIEKVRDIIERHTHIPRVVVVSGCDPVWFFATKLHLPLDYGYFLGPNNREGVGSVLDI